MDSRMRTYSNYESERERVGLRGMMAMPSSDFACVIIIDNGAILQGGPKRIRVFYFSPDFMVEFAKRGIPGGVEVVANAVPEDTTCIRAYYDGVRGSFAVVIASESFELVPPGALIPEHPPVEFFCVRR